MSDENPDRNMPEPGWTTPARIVRVIDGDTIEVLIEKSIRVRLIDCWAPETRTTDPAEKQRGIAARQHLMGLLTGQSVLVEIPGAQDFQDVLTMGRVLGHVWLQKTGKLVSRIMCDDGFATPTKNSDAGD